MPHNHARIFAVVDCHCLSIIDVSALILGNTSLAKNWLLCILVCCSNRIANLLLFNGTFFRLLFDLSFGEKVTTLKYDLVSLSTTCVYNVYKHLHFLIYMQ